MFVSEVEESYYMRIPSKEQEISYSNDLFASVLGKMIDNYPLDEVYDKLIDEYNCTSAVIQYNRERLYFAYTSDTRRIVRNVGYISEYIGHIQEFYDEQLDYFDNMTVDDFEDEYLSDIDKI